MREGSAASLPSKIAQCGAHPSPVSPALASISCRSTGRDFTSDAVNPLLKPVFPFLPSSPIAKPGNQTPGNPTAPSCSSKVKGFLRICVVTEAGVGGEMQTPNPPSAAQSNRVGGQERECGAHSNTKSRFCARLISVAG